MALLFMDGFDAEDTNLKWTLTGTSAEFTYITNTRFNIGKALKIIETTDYDASCYMLRSFTPSSAIYMGGAVKITWGVLNDYRHSANLFGLLGDSGVTGHVYIRRTLTNAVELYRGDPRYGSYASPSGTKLATTAAGVMDGNWHHIEMSATIDDSSGHVVVRLDGVTIIDFTGDTRNGGTSANIDTVCFKTGRWNWDSGDEINLDDFYVCNSTGTINNTFLGDVRVHTLMPTADTAAADFTPTGSSLHYANVSENPDSVATYNASATVGHKDLYAMADLPASVATIHAVQANNKAWKTDAGVIRLKNVIKSGANTASGDVVSLGTSAAINSSLFATDPATSAAWTTTGVNGVEAGVEVA